MLDRVVAMYMLKFIIEDFQFRGNFLESGVVDQIDFLPGIHIIVADRFEFHSVTSVCLIYEFAAPALRITFVYIIT